MISNFNPLLDVLERLGGLESYLLSEEEMALRWAEKVRDRAREKLGTYQGGVGPYPAWQPLKQSTLDRRGGKDLPLLDSESLYDAIEANVSDSGKTGWVGVRKDSGVGEYALVQEFGNLGQEPIPARPFMRPAIFELKEEIVRDAGYRVRLRLRRQGV